MSKLLEGVRVLDVSQVAAVPMAARILADRGADVIHVENPKLGDQFRWLLSFMSEKSGTRSRINYIGSGDGVAFCLFPRTVGEEPSPVQGKGKRQLRPRFRCS